jgi:hypothetical protein
MSTSAIHALHGPVPEGIVTLDGDGVAIHGLVVTDPAVVGLVTGAPADERSAVVERMLAVGARGIAAMGLGLDVASIDEQVRATVTAVTDEAKRQVEATLETAQRALTAQLDPEQRSSLVARIIGEFGEWSDGLLGTLDPGVEGSHTTTFLSRLTTLFGPDGEVETRLREALDPDADGSALGRVKASLEERIDGLHDLIVHGQGVDEGRTTEALRGTAQGVDFEDAVEALLRQWAGGIGGVVERTGRSEGSLGAGQVVGDFVITLADGSRIAVEAKNQQSVGLAGGGGILTELDRAMANRDAGVAICVSARDAFPNEVGSFNTYGSRILVVDDGEGTLLGVALRWAANLAALQAGGGDVDIDGAVVSDRLERLRKMAERFKQCRKALTDVHKNITKVHESLGDMRTDLLEHVDDLERELRRAV